MTDSVLYILGVPTVDDKKINSENKDTQLETEVATYVGVHSNKIVSNNITATDTTPSTWFKALTDVYDGNQTVIDIFFSDFLEDLNTAPKKDLFLLRMMYSEDTKNISEDKIEIIFFKEDGSKIVPIIVNDEPVIPESKSKTIKVLIKDLTGIEIKDSVNDSAKMLSIDRNASVTPSGPAPSDLQNSRKSVKTQMNPYKVLGKDQGGSSHKTRKGKRNNTKNNKKGGSKTKRKSSKKRVNKK
jgi:hypothetical protein